MSGKEIRDLLHASPFKPFTVFAAADREYLVEHPEFAYLIPTGRSLIVANKADDELKLLDVALINRVDIHDPKSPRRRR